MDEPAWLMTRSACAYSSCSDDLNRHTSTSPSSLRTHESPDCWNVFLSKSEFPHWTTIFEYPLARRTSSTTSERARWTRPSNRVDPTVTKTCMGTDFGVINVKGVRQGCDSGCWCLSLVSRTALPDPLAVYKVSSPRVSRHTSVPFCSPGLDSLFLVPTGKPVPSDLIPRPTWVTPFAC